MVTQYEGLFEAPLAHENEEELGRWLRKTARRLGVAAALTLGSVPSSGAQSLGQAVANVITERDPKQDEKRRQAQQPRGRDHGAGSPPSREYEGEWEIPAYAQQEATLEHGGDRFETRVYPFGSEGHEILTRDAAARAGVPAARRDALELGVIRPDRGGRSYLNFPASAAKALLPAYQAAHALRRTIGTTQSAALAEIRTCFSDLYGRAMAAPPHSDAAYEWIGEALHLLQDSYSLAHMRRNPPADPRVRGPFRITYIRNFGPLTGKPDEHGFPKDDRDEIGVGGSLKPEAQVAVNASIEYITMMLRHMTSGANRAELRIFMDRHLS